MIELSLIKSISENTTDLPSVWGKTVFHRSPERVKTSYSEDEESAETGKKIENNEDENQNSEKEKFDMSSDRISAEKSKDENIETEKKPEDPSRQGIIRKIDGAHLVYKRKNDSGTFDELWMFGFQNVFVNKNLKRTVNIKRAILAGTDIPVKDTRSPDGSQSCEHRIIGDAQFLFISGLPQ